MKTTLVLYVGFGDRSFTAAGPRFFNSLPPALRCFDIVLAEIRRHLFRLFGIMTFVYYDYVPCVNVLLT